MSQQPLKTIFDLDSLPAIAQAYGIEVEIQNTGNYYLTLQRLREWMLTGIYGLPTGGTNGQVLTKSGTNDGVATWNTLNLVTAFTALTDAPSSYTGQGGRGVRVNAGATGLEFYTLPTIPTQTSQLTNNSGFITSASIPTVVSAFTNDANYTTLAAVGAVGYLTGIPDNSVTSTKIVNGSVTEAKIADSSITSAKIADGTIATGDIANDAITFQKLQNIATNRLLGRSSTGSGDVEEIQLGSGLSLSAGTLSSTVTGGSIAVSDEGTQLTATATSLNFTGAGVTAINSGGAVTVNVPGGGAGEGLSRAKIHAIIASSL